MEIEKLKDMLRNAAGGPVGIQMCREAADALEQLQAENDRLKRERDAAVKDLNEFLSMDELCPIQCEWCKWNGTYCDGKTPKWRGQKGD